jgi:anaerobic ribonucleoside-triphosphate reductase
MDIINNESENDKKLKKSTSNIQKVKNVIKKRICIWNCCFCPGLQSIDCCNSCDFDLQSHLGI